MLPRMPERPLQSWYRPLCAVELPYKGRQAYMLSVDLSQPQIEAGYEEYLPLVLQLCGAAGVHGGTVHVTVDEKMVQAGQSQRRPGPHVDGCFTGGSWEHKPGWNHYCNHLPVPRMAVIVAASVPGCRVWQGEFHAVPRNNGDLSHARGQFGTGTLLPAGRGFLLSPDCVHESILFEQATQRTFLRVALPVGAV